MENVNHVPAGAISVTPVTPKKLREKKEQKPKLHEIIKNSPSTVINALITEKYRLKDLVERFGKLQQDSEVKSKLEYFKREIDQLETLLEIIVKGEY